MLASEPIELLAPPSRYVSRGGLKLEAALERFAISVTRKRALDAGSSTGGFTDALLQHGAAGVVAVDVGTHQLHERLRSDNRVELHEQTDIRSVDIDDIGGPFDIVVADLSFISVGLVLGKLLSLAGRSADVILLVKPQFEARRDEASKGKGVILDPSVWRRTLLEVVASAESAGAVLTGLIASPIRGGHAGRGNVEFLAHLRHVAATQESLESSRFQQSRTAALIDAVVQQVVLSQQESS